MKSRSAKFTFLFILVFLANLSNAADIKGRINLDSDWHPEVFLASINNPEDLFVSSPDFLLTSAPINPDGTFEISNLEIPAEFRFYRLYVLKNLFSPTDVINSGNRSLIHLILDNNSNVVLNITMDGSRATELKIEGSESSVRNREFDVEFLKRARQLSGKETRAQKEFIQLGIDNYIRTYVENCENALNGLYALYHIEEKEPDFLRNSAFYFRFQDKLHGQFPKNLYTDQYDELLINLVGFRDMVCEIPGVIPKWKDYLILIQGGVILLLLLLLFVNSVKKKNRRQQAKNGSHKLLYDKLTNKEMEILKLIAESKSNKEIASELFIELSTVKTHLNSIYKQLKVQNRKEAGNFYKEMNEN